MDYFTKHLAIYVRKFPAVSQVESVGDIVGKDHWIHRSFTTCNFSIILSGEGEFRRKGRIYPVQAPCVLTQWPDEMLHYGPKESWDEVYLIYHAKCMDIFKRMNFVNSERPMWQIHNLENVMVQVEKLRELVRKTNTETLVDRIDRVCEQLILSTLLPGTETEDEVLQKIVSRLRQKLTEPHDFNQIARQHGMSPSTFRRRWFGAFRTSPGRFLLDLRIQRARRLLAETSLQVGEISDQAGFQDMLYFSKRFKIETNLTPSEYRRHYRIKQ